MKILITGGLGFIGTHLERELKMCGHEITIFDRPRINRPNYIRGDICDGYSVRKAFEQVEPDVCVHLAAMVSRKESEETPYMAIQTNVDGSLNVVRNCIQHKTRLIYAGSSEEYGTAFNEGVKVREDTPFGEATSMYSLTKRMSEELIQYYALKKGLTATTTRFFMLYGPGEPATDYRSALIRFLDAGMNGKPLVVHKCTKRQWCYISDATDILRKIIEREQTVPYDVFNVGNPEETWTVDLARRIVNMTGNRSEIITIPVEETIIPIKLASFDKLKYEFDWQAKVDLEQGLKQVHANLKWRMVA